MATINQIIKQTKEQGFQDNLSMEVWLAFLLGEDRLFLFKNASQELTTKIEQAYWQGIAEMSQGRPLAQLTGGKEFYGLNFIVDENVLIPRPESELLVDLAKDFIENNFPDEEVLIADIGTGSGAILLALLKNLPKVQGVGTEISSAALAVARANAKELELEGRVEWLEGDLLEKLDRPCQVMVANLPYIGRDTFHFIAENVARYEPEVALYGGSDGLELYRRMFMQLTQKSWFPDLVLGEFGFGQQEMMEQLLNEYFSEKKATIIPDLAGIPRVFVIGS